MIILSLYLFINPLNSTANIFALLFREIIFGFGVILYTAPLLVNRLYPFGGWLRSSMLVSLSRVWVTLVSIAPFIISSIGYNMRVPYYHSTPYTIAWSFSFMIISILASILIGGLLERPLAVLNNLYFGEDSARDLKKVIEKEQ